jgi:hypothetical protein
MRRVALQSCGRYPYGRLLATSCQSRPTPHAGSSGYGHQARFRWFHQRALHATTPGQLTIGYCPTTRPRRAIALTEPRQQDHQYGSCSRASKRQETSGTAIPPRLTPLRYRRALRVGLLRRFRAIRRPLYSTGRSRSRKLLSQGTRSCIPVAQWLAILRAVLLWPIGQGPGHEVPSKTRQRSRGRSPPKRGVSLYRNGD